MRRTSNKVVWGCCSAIALSIAAAGGEILDRSYPMRSEMARPTAQQITAALVRDRETTAVPLAAPKTAPESTIKIKAENSGNTCMEHSIPA